MEHYKSLFNNLGKIDYPIITTNKRIKYINLPCGFDIETTSYKIGETKAAFMYVWMIGIGKDNGVYYGRTWEELQNLCLFLQLELGLCEEKRLVIYVHNLGYEFDQREQRDHPDQELARQAGVPGDEIFIAEDRFARLSLGRGKQRHDQRVERPERDEEQPELAPLRTARDFEIAPQRQKHPMHGAQPSFRLSALINAWTGKKRHEKSGAA